MATVPVELDLLDKNVAYLISSTLVTEEVPVLRYVLKQKLHGEGGLTDDLHAVDGQVLQYHQRHLLFLIDDVHRLGDLILDEVVHELHEALAQLNRNDLVPEVL